jgi:hypothetical protein
MLSEKEIQLGVANVYTHRCQGNESQACLLLRAGSIIHFLVRIFKNGRLMITTKTLGVWNNANMRC